MKIEFRLDRIDDFLPAIAQQVGLPIENDRLRLPKDHGEGFFTQHVFNNNFAISYYELDLFRQTTIIRHKSNEDNLMNIVFWASGAGVIQKFNADTKIVGKNTRNGISFSSNSLEARYSFPAGVSIKSIAFIMDKKWLQNIIYSQNDYISNYIIKQQKYFIFEEISLPMEQVLLKIEEVIKNKIPGTLAKLQLYALALTLANRFFEKLLQRSSNNTFINIKPHDIENLFKIKSIISDNYIDFPTIDFLAKESGMNERKLQKLFKQVFGKSIYQYALVLKINRAKRLLESKKYSVSEVGYMVGYSNLSHFTQKFKEHTGTTPKTFLSSL